MQFSHSRVECFGQCPYRYKLRYLDGLDVPPNIDDPTNALLLGSALHLGIEKGVKAGIQAYYDAYPVITDSHVNEAIKLEWLIPQVQKLIPEGATFERRISGSHFIGFIDLLISRGNGEYELWDFKYSNHVDKYLASAQLHLYKHYFEEQNPNCRIVKMGFIFIPKTAIRQKKTEDLYQFRKRLRETLEGLEVRTETVEYDPNKVIRFLTEIKTILEAKDFPKNESKLCDWCDYQLYCKEGVDYMLLPKNERRVINLAARKKIWIYGAPFSGKTTLADHFPNPIMLNTDGNLNSFTAPVIEVKETLDGRIKTPAWENFKAAIDELQKGSDFETIVVDLVEDAYEHCRRWCYQKYGFEHESDAGYGKGYDLIRTEFLSTMKRLMTLDYNIVLISHEDISRDITRKSGDKITSVRPNIQDKVANKLAGMVDIVARVVADGDNRTLQFKSDDVVFGGGRLKLFHTVVPLTYASLEEVYEEAGGKPAAPKQTETEAKPVISKETEAAPEEEPTKMPIAEEEEPPFEAPKAEEQPVRRRRRRVTEE